MFNIGRNIPARSVLSWRDVWDNLIRFVKGINSVDRDSLLIGSVTPAMVADDALISGVGYREHDIRFTPIASHELHTSAASIDSLYLHADVQRYKLYRKVLSLEDHEVGTYVVQWRVSIDFQGGTAGGTAVRDILYHVECSVDGVRAGGPFGADDFHVAVDPAKGSALQWTMLSGVSFCYLLPGSHTVDLDFFNGARLTRIQDVDMMVVRLGW